MRKMPKGAYVVSWSVEDKNPDGTPEHSVFGPIDESRLEEWCQGPGELLAEGGDAWDFYDAEDVVPVLMDLEIKTSERIVINDPWPTDEGFTKSTTFLADMSALCLACGLPNWWVKTGCESHGGAR